MGIFIIIIVDITPMEYTGREYGELLGLKPPWIVERVIIDPAKKRVDVYISHTKGGMKCPSCGLECMVYDHLDERVWRDLNSIDFATFLHAKASQNILQ